MVEKRALNISDSWGASVRPLKIYRSLFYHCYIVDLKLERATAVLIMKTNLKFKFKRRIENPFTGIEYSELMF